jgi:hypothetical protein
VKPGCQFKSRTFPKTDFFFHSGLDVWRGYWSGNDDEERRNRHNLGREYLIESARERTREAIAFGAVVIASAWPVIYMIVTVVQLLLKGRPLDR